MVCYLVYYLVSKDDTIIAKAAELDVTLEFEIFLDT